MNVEIQILYMLIFSSMVGIYTAMAKPDSYLFDPDIIIIAGLVVYIDVVWFLLICNFT
jgi:hypothetical protein